MTPIVLTGPGGWIGSAMLAHLAHALGAGWEAGVSLWGSSARTLVAPDGTVLPVRPLAELRGHDTAGALVLHLAYLTKEKADLLGEARFRATNAAIDAQLLAACRNGAPAGVFVASSGAARLDETGEDPHPYGATKREQEAAFLEWGGAARVPVLAGRIFNLAGPHINKLDSYALSSFLTDALTRGTIRIAATRPVFRAYLHVDDLAALVLATLRAGDAPGAPVDLAGPETVEMIDVAQAAARAAGIAGDAIVRAPVTDWTPSRYLGDPVPARLLAMRAGVGLRPFAVQVADTAADLRTRLPGLVTSR